MLREEIKPYVDGNGYICPNIPGPGTMRGSDNGTMFTSEYYIMLHRLLEDNERDADEWETLIQRCMSEPGLTTRAPGDTALDSPDDMLAILNAAQTLGKFNVAQSIYSYGLKHFGVFNPSAPSTFTFSAFLWRQPQLFAAAAAASKKLSLLHLPVTIYTALVILYAGLKNYDKDKTDERRLAWHLIQIMSPESLLCRWASKVWYSKLYKDYPNGMKDVAAIYYQQGHPFAKYWVS